MAIVDSIKHAKALLEQALSNHNINSNAEFCSLLVLLDTELDSIYQQAHQLIKSEPERKTSETKPKTKAGCYVFENEKGFFCPHCYDNHQVKIATTRINSKLRVCPNCRESIK